MGILDSLTKNPSIIALAALGIGLFIFRDRISGFFSDITGGAKGAASIAETGGLLSRNFTSFLTATPLAEDPIFGEQGFFANISKGISDFKLPSFELPSFELPSLPSFPPTTSVEGNFTDTGMAKARARQESLFTLPRSPEEIARDDPFAEVVGGTVLFSTPRPETPFAVANVEETQSEFQERAASFVQAFPDLTRSTSLPDSQITFGRQLSRNQEDFEGILAAEAARSESIFAGLFGNVQNPNF